MDIGIRIRQERQRHHLSQEALAGALGTTAKSISRWECGQAIPQAHYRLQLCRLFDLRPEELFGEATSQEQEISPAFWNVPYQRNPFFTGREEILCQLHEKLNREHAMALAQSWAISGLGGIGKTQIALEYAYRYCRDYHYVFWASAATREILLADLTEIANLLQLPEEGERDQNQMILAIKKWFATHQEWLLILDGADDVTIIHDIVPMECSGYLLLTTRAQALGSLAQRIEVESMGMAEGTLFLLRRAKILEPDADLDQASQDQFAIAETIIIEMDFLPLALDQAGAYIDEVGCSLSAYLDLYRTHRKELLQRRGHMPTGHPESVAATWSLSFEKIGQANPIAAELLHLCAFLEPDAIPEELFSEGSTPLGHISGPAIIDALKLNEAIEELRKFSLVQRNAESKLLCIHRLVQAVLKDSMEIEEQRQWAERAVRITSTIFPDAHEVENWGRCQRYLPQAQKCVLLIQEAMFTFEQAILLLFNVANYLYNRALYELAEQLFLQALHLQEAVFGSNHPSVATSLYQLARFYQKQGKYEQAQSSLESSIRQSEVN